MKKAKKVAKRQRAQRKPRSVAHNRAIGEGVARAHRRKLRAAKKAAPGTTVTK